MIYSKIRPEPNQELRTTASSAFNGITIKSLYKDSDGTKAAPLTGEVRGIFITTTDSVTKSIDDALMGEFSFKGKKNFAAIDMSGTLRVVTIDPYSVFGWGTLAISGNLSVANDLSVTRAITAGFDITSGRDVIVPRDLHAQGIAISGVSVLNTLNLSGDTTAQNISVAAGKVITTDSINPISPAHGPGMLTIGGILQVNHNIYSSIDIFAAANLHAGLNVIAGGSVIAASVSATGSGSFNALNINGMNVINSSKAMFCLGISTGGAYGIDIAGAATMDLVKTHKLYAGSSYTEVIDTSRNLKNIGSASVESISVNTGNASITSAGDAVLKSVSIRNTVYGLSAAGVATVKAISIAGTANSGFDLSGVATATTFAVSGTMYGINSVGDCSFRNIVADNLQRYVGKYVTDNQPAHIQLAYTSDFSDAETIVSGNTISGMVTHVAISHDIEHRFGMVNDKTGHYYRMTMRLDMRHNQEQKCSYVRVPLLSIPGMASVGSGDVTILDTFGQASGRKLVWNPFTAPGPISVNPAAFCTRLNLNPASVSTIDIDLVSWVSGTGATNSVKYYPTNLHIECTVDFCIGAW